MELPGIFPWGYSNLLTECADKVCIVSESGFFCGLLNAAAQTEQLLRVVQTAVKNIAPQRNTGFLLKYVTQVVFVPI